MIHLDAATVLLQWAVGGLAFLWFTTRRHEISLGYSMLLRITYGVFAAGACGFGLRYGVEPVREVSAVAVAVASFALIRNKRSRLDFIAPLLGVPGILVAGFSAVSDGSAGDYTVSLIRVVVGTLFLGAVSDTMLLGHWYLVQPGMPRKLINEIVDAVLYLWPFEVIAFASIKTIARNSGRKIAKILNTRTTRVERSAYVMFGTSESKILSNFCCTSVCWKVHWSGNERCILTRSD